MSEPPPNGEDVLVFGPDRSDGWLLGIRDGSDWYIGGLEDVCPDFWLPMPAHPVEDEG